MAPPVLARVRVTDAECDVLFLIAQHLRDLGLCTTVVALLRESGIDPFWLCGPSREIALLREWIFQGEWTRVRALVQPLTSAIGARSIAEALARVDKQELLEEFYLTSTSQARRREIVEQLQAPTAHSAAKLTKHELYHCVRRLQREDGLSYAWSLDAARLSCFESLVPLFRDAIGPDDEEHKYITMPRRQLVALLQDALVLNKKQQGHDFISVTPLSGDTLAKDTVGGSSSLRLAEPHENSDDSDTTNMLSQSEDFSRVQMDHKRASTSTDRSKNPLVMSMAFSRSRRVNPRSSVSSADEVALATTAEEDSEPHDEAVDNAINPRTFDDAETQTDIVLSVNQAIETSGPPVHIVTEQVLSQKDEVEVEMTAEPSNQTTDIDTPAFNPSASRSRSSEADAIAVIDAPLEAWCTSRRAELLEEPPSPQEHNSPRNGESIMNEKPDEWTEQPAENDGPMRYDDDENPEQSDDDERPRVPPRSYDQLNIDSVVRAQVIAEVREAQAIRAMDMAPDGSEMVIGTNARALRVFDLTEPLASSSLSNSGGLSFLPLLPVSLERHKHHSSSIYTACYNHDSATSLIATGAAESSIKVLSRWTQQEVSIRGHSGKSRALCFASANLLCSAASGDMVARVWEVDAASASGVPCVQRLDGHVGEIQAMAISSTSTLMDRQCLVTSSMDRTVRLWDLRSAQCAGVLARTTSVAYTLAFRPETHHASSMLATGHEDGSISLWDLRKSSSTRATNPVVALSHHQDECRAVSWSPDGQWLLSASFDGTLCLVDASGGALSAAASFHQHQDKILQAQWHPSQPAIVTTGADKLVKLWGF